MDRQKFRKFIESNIMILDGATGTQLQKKGMPKGMCPEQWVLEHPDILVKVQREYIKAGSNVVYTCTFGANELKLNEFGLDDKTVLINKELAKISKKAAGQNCLVAGDIAPTGQFIRPIGQMTFEQIVNAYKKQVKGLLEGGVDFFVIETMMDLQEARAALLAVKESCDLPVCVSMTFNEDGKTLTGTDSVTAVITLQALGADVVGCNCSTGPKHMIDIIKKMKPYAKVPLLAKPNAGLPKLVNGESVFDMSVEEFGSYVSDLIEAGVNVVGGCCGTSPKFINEIKKYAEKAKPKLPKISAIGALTSSRNTVFIDTNQPLRVVGERINPTGKKKLQKDLLNGNVDEVLSIAMQQVECGADVLDINLGMPGIDEREMMINVIENLASTVHTPLCIDSSSPEVIEAALRVYPGRALINSISAESEKLEKLLPVAAKYGAMFILLPLGDKGIPKKAEERFEVIEKVYNEAQKYGICKQDIIIDGLVMTVSTNQKAAAETLKVIDWSTNDFGCCTIIGLSNISFGLPEREWINTAFMTMAVDRGLTMAIANPSSKMLMNIKSAVDVLAYRDKECKNYINRFSKRKIEDKSEDENKINISIEKKIYSAVIKGDSSNIKDMILEAVNKGIKPSKIMDEYLIAAINYVGELFERHEYFLPQLIKSGKTMQEAFECLQPFLNNNTNDTDKKIKIILATVKGDIHDIGKNIVGLMLKNHGFEVYDLGKDVNENEIINKAKEINADIVGLSALMTTTMPEMKTVIDLAKKEGLVCKFMIGGAAVTQQYADEIGADGYSKDANSAVKLAKRLSSLD